MRIVFFIVYISLFFCKNVGAIQHAPTHALHHGHFSMPKGNPSGQHSSIKAEQSFDLGLIEGIDDLGDLELDEDNPVDLSAIKLDWLGYYLNFLISNLLPEEPKKTTHFTSATSNEASAPIYILNQVFRI